MTHLIKLELKKFGIAHKILSLCLPQFFSASFSLQYLYGIA